MCEYFQTYNILLNFIFCIKNFKDLYLNITSYLNQLLAIKILKFYKKDFEILKYSVNSWDQF